MRAVVLITGCAAALVFSACTEQDPTEPSTITATPASPGISLLETSGAWATKAPMPTPRSRLKAASVNGVIYAIGGFAQTSTGNFVRPKVEAYDVATNTWTVKRPLPEPLMPNGATNINGKIYVAGGVSNDGRISKALYVYDPMTNGWTRKADMPFRVAGEAGHQGAINGKLYVYAGITINTDGSRGPHRFFRYNPATNGWVTLQPPSYARYGGASGVMNGRLYLLGGTLPTSRNGTGFAFDVHIYDPAAGWTKKPVGHYGFNQGMAYATLGGKLYVVGVNWSDGCFYRSSGVYDPATNTVSPIGEASSLLDRAAGGAAKGQFFVIGGTKSDPDSCEDLDLTGDVEAYTP